MYVLAGKPNSQHDSADGVEDGKNKFVEGGTPPRFQLYNKDLKQEDLKTKLASKADLFSMLE